MKPNRLQKDKGTLLFAKGGKTAVVQHEEINIGNETLWSAKVKNNIGKGKYNFKELKDMQRYILQRRRK